MQLGDGVQRVCRRDVAQRHAECVPAGQGSGSGPVRPGLVITGIAHWHALPPPPPPQQQRLDMLQWVPQHDHVEELGAGGCCGRVGPTAVQLALVRVEVGALAPQEAARGQGIKPNAGSSVASPCRLQPAAAWQLPPHPARRANVNSCSSRPALHRHQACPTTCCAAGRCGAG
jgi:hypothetical protein